MDADGRNNRYSGRRIDFGSNNGFEDEAAGCPGSEAEHIDATDAGHFPDEVSTGSETSEYSIATVDAPCSGEVLAASLVRQAETHALGASAAKRLFSTYV